MTFAMNSEVVKSAVVGHFTLKQASSAKNNLGESSNLSIIILVRSSLPFCNQFSNMHISLPRRHVTALVLMQIFVKRTK